MPASPAAAPKNKINKILLAIAIASMLIAVSSPILLDSAQCTTEINQQQREASGCVIGADFGPAFGIMFGIGLAITALTLALILRSARYKRLSFLAKFFLLLPIVFAFLFCLYVLLYGVISFYLFKSFR